jgi:hypothetical protein
MENLDLACAGLGFELAGIRNVEDKLITSALSVLEEQGVYAFFLYLLKARRGQPGGQISASCHAFLKKHPATKPLLTGNQQDVLVHIHEKLADDLDGLLLARDLLRQGLIYARYHAKAAQASGANTP